MSRTDIKYGEEREGRDGGERAKEKYVVKIGMSCG